MIRRIKPVLVTLATVLALQVFPPALGSVWAASPLDVPLLSQYLGQSTENADCGPTSLAMILQYFGIATDISSQALVSEIRSRTSRPSGGDTFFEQDLIPAAETYGLSVRPLQGTPETDLKSIGDAVRIGTPVIALIHGADLGRVGVGGSNYGDHFVVVTGFSADNSQVFFNDADIRGIPMPGVPSTPPLPPAPWQNGGSISMTASAFRQSLITAVGDTPLTYAIVLSGGTIAGVVRSSSGSPVAGATVVLSGNRNAKSATTASDGSYVFSNVPTGKDPSSIAASVPGASGTVSVAAQSNASIRAPDLFLASNVCVADSPQDEDLVIASIDTAEITLADGSCGTSPPPTPAPGALLAIAFSPTSAQSGSAVSITATAIDTTYNTIRVTLPCGSPGQYETGAPTLTFTWSTSGCASGSLSILAQARKSDDPTWARPISVNAMYSLAGCLDTTAPTTTVTLSGTQGNHGWFRSPVTAVLSADDPGCSGLASTQYSLDGTNWTQYSGPIQFPNEGRFQFQYRSNDHAGNTETAKSAPINIDWTPPTVSAFATAPLDMNGIWRDSVLNRLAVSDNLSGKDYAEYSLNGTAYNQLPGTLDSFTLGASGIFRCSFDAVDMAGNRSQTYDSGVLVIYKQSIFANSKLSISGSGGMTINGEIFSNCTISLLNNVNVTLTGPVSAACGGNTVSGNVGLAMPQLNTGVPQVAMLDYPLGFYKSRCTVFSTKLVIDTVGKQINRCLYSSGDIEVDAVNLGGSVSLVSEGSILDSSGGSTFQSADPANGMLEFAQHDVVLNTTGNRTLGLIYAPNGTIRGSATNFELTGSLVANQVLLNGWTTFKLDYSAGFPSQTVQLPVASPPMMPSTAPPPLPAVPGGLWAGPTPSRPQITGFAWDDVSGADGYELQVANSAQFGSGSLVVNVATVDAGESATLTAGTSYYMRVRSVNLVGASGWSPVLGFTAPSATPTSSATATRTATPSPTAVATSTPTARASGTQAATPTPGTTPFQASVSPTSLAVAQFSSGILNVTIRAGSGVPTTTYTTKVTGLPAGALASSPSVALSGGQSITTAVSVAAGSAAKATYPIQLLVTAAGGTQSIPITFMVL
jgi:hypothetical protein